MKQERLLAGQERAALASTLGISEQRLEDYEAGRRRMPPAAMVRASEALGLPLSVLFFGDGGTTDAADSDEPPPRIAVARPIGLIGRGIFAPLVPFLEVWRSNRGRLPADIADFVARAGLMHRTVFARRPPRSARLVVEHLGAGIEMFRPCESLLLVGRDIADLADRDYGAWVADTYARTLADEQPVLESVRATIRAMDGRLIEGRYDRFLLPWFGAGGERFVLCISLTQTSRVVEPAEG